MSRNVRAGFVRFYVSGPTFPSRVTAGRFFDHPKEKKGKLFLFSSSFHFWQGGGHLSAKRLEHCFLSGPVFKWFFFLCGLLENGKECEKAFSITNPFSYGYYLEMEIFLRIILTVFFLQLYLQWIFFPCVLILYYCWSFEHSAFLLHIQSIMLLCAESGKHFSLNRTLLLTFRYTVFCVVCFEVSSASIKC